MKVISKKNERDQLPGEKRFCAIIY